MGRASSHVMPIVEEHMHGLAARSLRIHVHGAGFRGITRSGDTLHIDFVENALAVVVALNGFGFSQRLARRV